ncbi:MAG: FHA domain-containing protein [Anaerolineae bacterium]
MSDSEIKLLLRVSGPDMEETQLLVGRQGLRVGRTRDNQLALENREISRQHMRIVWRDDKYFVEDLNSSNGTWLNDNRLTPRDLYELRPDDIVRVGPYLIRIVRFEIVSTTAVVAAAPEPVTTTMEMEPVRRAVRAAEQTILARRSTWLNYLPAIFSDDSFTERYLLVFESIFSPIMWMLDNYDQYLDPDTAPTEWLQWISSWFDIMMLPELPIERQRAIARQVGWLFSRRGTRVGLQRLLELYFDFTPEIIEPEDEPCHFVVKLRISQSPLPNAREVAERLIQSQKPAFASYTVIFE